MVDKAGVVSSYVRLSFSFSWSSWSFSSTTTMLFSGDSFSRQGSISVVVVMARLSMSSTPCSEACAGIDGVDGGGAAAARVNVF